MRCLWAISLHELLSALPSHCRTLSLCPLSQTPPRAHPNGITDWTQITFFFFPLGNAFSLESEENFFFFFPSLQSLFKSLCRKQILAGSLEPLMSAELLPTKGSCRISHWMVTSLQQQEIQVGLKVGPCSGSTTPYHVVPTRFPQPVSVSPVCSI